MIIGIEGPAGAGKSTMANTVASELHAPVIEGGCWYRALTYAALRQGVSPEEKERVVELAKNLDVAVEAGVQGTTLKLNGEDITNSLYTEEVSAAIGPYAHNLRAREVIEPQIANEARAHPLSIVVGRHLKKPLPEAYVLRVAIDEEEAERRHVLRAGVGARAVADRNATDKKTAELLKTDDEDIVTVNVSRMTPEEQADVLRRFIAESSSNEGIA